MRFGTFLVATLLVLAGVAMFMLNLGYGSWEMVRQAIDLWPVLLILLGLSLFWGGRIPHWLALALVVALAGAIVFLFLKEPGILADGSHRQIAVERWQYPGLSSGEANITFGGGRIALGTDTDKWLAGRLGGRGIAS